MPRKLRGEGDEAKAEGRGKPRGSTHGFSIERGPMRPTSPSTRRDDPHAEREAQRYERPIASRESILEFLAGHDSARVKEIAAHLGVSQPTATDSIAALERKGLVVKASAQGDKRATAIRITAEGKAAFGSVSPIETAAMEAARSLSPGEQEGLLLSLVKMIRHLQEADAIPIQRMCTSCRYFRPYQHSGEAKPHHCNFVNAAFGSNELRIDCRDHETADPATRAATWDAFEKG